MVFGGGGMKEDGRAKSNSSMARLFDAEHEQSGTLEVEKPAWKIEYDTAWT